jgi:hypothetical protein
MEEKRISLFDASIGDEDVMAFGDIVYKVANIRSVFDDLLVLIYPQFTSYLNKQGASKFGLANADNSLSDIYSGDYYDFKYLKLGSSDWAAGKLKIYLSVFLHREESSIKEQLKAGCYYPHIYFDDNDVISLKEDCLCKIKPIKAIFNTLASDGTFADSIAQRLTKSIAEFNGYRLFSTGKPCELLRLGSSNWEPMILSIQFTIDAIEDSPRVERNIVSDEIESPLDEIRNASIEYH